MPSHKHYMPDSQNCRPEEIATCGRFMLFRTAGKLECPVQPSNQSATSPQAHRETLCIEPALQCTANSKAPT